MTKPLTAPIPQPATPDAALNQLIMASWVSKLLHIAAELRIADILADGPELMDTIADRCKAHPRNLYRVLRALASVGVFAEDGQGRFENTELSHWLRSDIPGSVRSMARMNGHEISWRSWGDVLHSLRTGEPAFEHVYGKPLFDYLSEQPEAAEIFNEAMTSFATQVHAAVAESYDFQEFRSIVDVGGGHGTLVTSILRRFPDIRGVLFDLPHVVEGAGPVLGEGGVTDRVERVGGSFFEPIPGGHDAYVLATIIHDWDDARAEKILRNCRDAMGSTGRLLLVEQVVPSGNGSHFAKLLDLEMLIMAPGGRERTAAEFRDLLARTGFRLTRIIQTATPMCVIEAVPDDNPSAGGEVAEPEFTQADPPPAPVQLTNMSMGLWISQAIYAVTAAGIPDLLALGSTHVDDLAKRSGTHAPALFRFLRALAMFDVVRETDSRVFELGILGQHLSPHGAPSLKAWAIMRGRPWTWRSWGDLLETVRTGETAFDRVFGQNPWQFFAANPEDAAGFDAAMTTMTRAFGDAVVTAYDWSSIETLVDIAGGHGQMLSSILKAAPTTQGVLFDLPNVVEGAQAMFDREGVANRTTIVSGDFFTAVPEGADAYFLKFIIHDWDDDRAVKILETIRKAIRPGGRLLLVEMVLAPGNEPHFGKLLDMEMMAIPGGVERSEAEYGALFARAGFRLTRVIPTESPMCVIEGMVDESTATS